MKIQSSCASISEEELAKLSVNLLNCQSAVEGRQQFPCTEKMVEYLNNLCESKQVLLLTVNNNSFIEFFSL